MDEDVKQLLRELGDIPTRSDAPSGVEWAVSDAAVLYPDAVA